MKTEESTFRWLLFNFIHACICSLQNHDIKNDNKEEGKLMHKGFFGVGKCEKGRISKLRTSLTKATIQYTFKMHLKAVKKSNTIIISCSRLHNIN